MVLHYHMTYTNTKQESATPGYPCQRNVYWGRRSDAHKSGFRSRPRSEASEYLKDLHMALAHAWKCGTRLKHAKPSPRVHVSPFACVRCNLKRRFWTSIMGKLPVPVKPGRMVPSPCEPTWFYIII